MATYFHGGPEIQPVDGLQTLYLMNPSYVGYSDATGPQAGQQQPNMVFLNSPLSSLNSIPQSQQQHQHQHHQQQHFVGIPLQPTQQPTAQYNIWAPTPVDVQAHSGPIRPAGLSLSLQSTEEAKIAAGPSTNGLQSVLMGSKYLKAAQQLLDEVASVGKDGRSEAAAGMARKGDEKCGVKGGKDLEGEGGEGKRGAELSTAERQELQMKKAKLVNMLDEVEQRYRQYHHQMQIVVSSFESVAGFGSARTYTSLALQTISKQFRCLRDAITGQIRGTSKSLGEEDCVGAGGSKSVGSRLRFVDHHLRQQRALQQLGMIQHNAWRPQRGLPERAVSVLRAWLFEHFLHPYPKDSDKHMLAKQTGLTRSQVSNWFINARVRLWKPMVEEMYLEETKEQEQNDDANNNNNNDKSEASDHSASKSISQQANSSTPSRAENAEGNNLNTSDLAIFEAHNEEPIARQQRLNKKARSSSESLHLNPMHHAPHQMGGMEMKPDALSNRELLMKFMDQQGGGFGGYPMGGIGRFDHHEQFAPRYGGNGVSLTLGLPHCETLSLSGPQQPAYISNDGIQMGRRIELGSEENNYFNINSSNGGGGGGNNHPSAPNPPNAYESINIQSRKRFAAQLLPDFVA